MKFRNPFRYLSKFEWILWLASLGAVSGAFLFGKQFDGLTLAASAVGVTALMFVAKGDVFGQGLTVLFSLLYAVISYTFQYYGEMITYLGMTAPIAALSLAAWIRHPYEKSKAEVKVARLGWQKAIFLLLLTGVVTFAFFFILAYFHTANLAVSTVSIATSFMASYLMLYRSPFYAVAYAANDVVLIILWILAAMDNSVYLPMVVCFSVFFVNDLYGFANWRRMHKRQKIRCSD